MRKICIVSGCAGFVGSHLCQSLLESGCRVIGIDNLTTGRPKNMSRFYSHPEFIFINGDIRDAPRLVSPFMKDGELKFFHLAAIVSVPYSISHPEETMEVNYEASLALLDFAERSGAQNFIFAGSAAEYGAIEKLPLSEGYADDGVMQLSPYGRAKYLASRAVSSSRIGCSLRFFNIYGPRQDSSSPYSGVISRFVNQILHGDPITIQGDGGQTRDFVFIKDVIAAYFLASGLTRFQPLYGIYNVGSETSTSVLDLGRILVRMTSSSSPILYCKSRVGDIRHSLADTSRLRGMGFSPQYSLHEGLIQLLEFTEHESL